VSDDRTDPPAASDRFAKSMLAAIVQSTNAAVIGKTLGGVVITWNAGAEKMFGFSAAEMIGQPIAGIAPAARAAEMQEILQRIRRGERVPPLESERLHKDGHLVPVVLEVSPIRDDAGRIIGASKIAHEISHQRRLETELRRREAELGAIVAGAPEAIVAIDQTGRIRSFNPSAERQFGYRAEEVIGENVSVLMPAPHAERHDRYIGRYLETGERRIIGIGRVVVGRRKDGSTFPLELAISEVSVGPDRHFVGFARDLTERQEMEDRLQELHEKLMRVSRLSAMGQMGAALAHELNQPLTAILNYSVAAKHIAGRGGTDALAQLPGLLQQVSEQATRAGQIIRHIRQFVEKGASKRQTEDVNQLVEEACALALVGTKQIGIKSTFELSANLPPISVDKVQIQQVIMNLVRNAVDAMSEHDRRELRVTTREAASGMIAVGVADSGPGLSEQVRARLFQPFVSSKADGMGIGLSICRAIVQAHHGRISSEPNPGGGAHFVFELPHAGIAADTATI